MFPTYKIIIKEIIDFILTQHKFLNILLTSSFTLLKYTHSINNLVMLYLI